MHLDVGEQRIVDDDHERRYWIRQRHRDLQRRGEHSDERSLRHADDRRSDFLGDTVGGHRMHVLSVGHIAVDVVGGWRELVRCDDCEWMRLDGNEQRQLDHGHEHRERHGKYHGGVQRNRKHFDQSAKRDDYSRRTDVHGYASWRVVRVFTVARFSVDRRRRWQRIVLREHVVGLCMDGHERRELDHDQGQGQRNGQWHGERHHCRQHGHVAANRHCYGRRPDLYRHAGGSSTHLHVCDLAGLTIRTVERRKRHDQRDGRKRV